MEAIELEKMIIVVILSRRLFAYILDTVQESQLEVLFIDTEAKKLRDRLQIFVSYSYREFVALYDIDTIFYNPYTNQFVSSPHRIRMNSYTVGM